MKNIPRFPKATVTVRVLPPRGLRSCYIVSVRYSRNQDRTSFGNHDCHSPSEVNDLLRRHNLTPMSNWTCVCVWLLDNDQEWTEPDVLFDN